MLFLESQRAISTLLYYCVRSGKNHYSFYDVRYDKSKEIQAKKKKLMQKIKDKNNKYVIKHHFPNVISNKPTLINSVAISKFQPFLDEYEQ